MKLPARERLRHYLPVAMVAIGTSLLLYVGVQYASMYLEQHNLARAWQQQQVTPYARAQDHALRDSLTRLWIPSINLSAIVVEGTTRRDLLLGPGHIKNTAEPGELGNAVITAHRDTFFRHLHELNKGDIINVQRGGKTYRYAVIAKKVVDPEDTSVIQPSKDNRLTLITCYPTYYIGPAPDRLVVFTRMVDPSDASPPVKNARASVEPTTRQAR